MKKQSSIILSLVAVAVLSAGIFSTVGMDSKPTHYIGSALPDYPIEFLAENTPFAIKGKVIDLVDVPIQIDEVGIGNVLTDVVINVKKDLSGQYTDDTITVRVQGGETDTAKYVHQHAPEFAIGEKVFILVADKEPESIYGDNYYVAGLQHGKYNLDEDGKAKNKDSNKDTSLKSLEDKVKKAKQNKIHKTK